MPLNRLFRTTLLALTLLVFALSAFADANSDARKAIEAIQQKEHAALKKKDLNAAFAYHTADYEAISKEGAKMNLKQTRQMMEPQMKAIKSLDLKSAIQKISVKGAQATLTVKDDATLVVVNPQDNKTLKVVVTNTTEELWVKTAKGWMRKRTRVLTSQQSMK